MFNLLTVLIGSFLFFSFSGNLIKFSSQVIWNDIAFLFQIFSYNNLIKILILNT